MAKVVFWSPDKNMAGSTLAAIAVSTVMSATHKTRSLLINGDVDTRKIESSFTPYYELKESGIFNNSNIGVEAILRLVISNKLSSDIIKNYAKPVLKDRLDILYGVSTKDDEQINQMLNSLTYIVRKASETYDVVFVDVPRDKNNKGIDDLIEDADILVCVVNQDITSLDDFFDKIEKNEKIKDKNKIFVVGNHEARSKYNNNNIKSKYRLKEPIYEVPINFVFNDSCNDGEVIDFVYKNINIDRKDYNGDFIYKVSMIVEKILEMAKIKDL